MIDKPYFEKIWFKFQRNFYSSVPDKRGILIIGGGLRWSPELIPIVRRNKVSNERLYEESNSDSKMYAQNLLDNLLHFLHQNSTICGSQISKN